MQSSFSFNNIQIEWGIINDICEVETITAPKNMLTLIDSEVLNVDEIIIK